MRIIGVYYIASFVPQLFRPIGVLSESTFRFLAMLSAPINCGMFLGPEYMAQESARTALSLFLNLRNQCVAVPVVAKFYHDRPLLKQTVRLLSEFCDRYPELVYGQDRIPRGMSVFPVKGPGLV